MRRSVKAGVALAFLWLVAFGALGLVQTPSRAEGDASALAEVTSHRGVYTLKLLQARSASGIMGACGTAYFEWAKICEGYLVNQYIRMQLAMGEGQSSVAMFIFSSLENAEGTGMSFKLRQFADGAVTQELEGVAELGSNGGVAHFNLPERKNVMLSAGTMFPSRFIRRSLAAMIAGAPLFTGVLFDGSTMDGAYHVATFFGPLENRPRPGGKPGEVEAFWSSRAGYFQVGSEEAEPIFEVGSMVNAGGLAEWFDLDYGIFSVRASLSEIERLPEPKC
ncbi:MAG: DUF1849 family protein [Alphaproteobacteria bacterium]|nr:DUF1849 family protein [Alphaproteobacteria bacterium]